MLCKGIAKDLVKILRDAKQDVPRELDEMSSYGGGGEWFSCRAELGGSA